MAGRAKKDATEGIANLKNYLRRDHSGLNMLKAIEKYLGDLRRTQKTLKAEVERLEANLANSESVKSKLAFDHVQAVADLQREKTRTTQLTFELSQTKERNEELQAKWEESEIPEEPPEDYIKGFSHENVRALLKELRKRMRYVPAMVELKRDARCLYGVFALDQFIKRPTQDGYLLIGMFTVAMCVMNFPVGFSLSEQNKGNMSEENMRRFIAWTGKLYRTDDMQGKVYDRTESPELRATLRRATNGKRRDK